ncbi:MAG: hypothetical protein HWQ23_27835 [Nostoc sp. JL33]|uniref:hypothetical protein n=1 Tax=Nostoc sp. JL33 TaxID=2815396 RepID=UPI0025CDC775|nr:hypothetical protein [Nostoc sp. JL33]MBN3873942.1 hypothetical protein [Nostoc sp. JL33]
MNPPQQVPINNFSVPQLNRRLETASTQAKPTFPCATLRERGFQTLNFSLVRAGGLLCETLFAFVCVAANSIRPALVKSAVRNRVYTGKTHGGGFQTLSFSLVRAGGLLCETLFAFVCVAANSIRPDSTPLQPIHLLQMFLEPILPNCY